MLTSLAQLVPTLSHGRVLVVGDLAIDEMIFGQTARLSREAPVLILTHERTEMLLGAASNAAHNLSSLSAAQVYVAGVYGADYHGPQLKQAFERSGINTDALVLDPARPTTTKTRISGIANHSITQQIVRIDRESHQPISAEIEAQLIEKLTQLAPDLDAILLSDYGLGVVTPGIIDACRRLSQTHGLVWTVDSQQDLKVFYGATIVTPNQPEAERNLNLCDHALSCADETINTYGAQLLAAIQTQYLLITRGASGMSLFGPEAACTHIPVFNRSEVFDVTGAGDTVVATLTLVLAAWRRQTKQPPTWSMVEQAAQLGNLAASIVVKHFGVCTTTQADLLQAIKQLDLKATSASRLNED